MGHPRRAPDCALDRAARRAATHWYDPRPCHRCRYQATADGCHRELRRTRGAEPDGRPLHHDRRPSGHRQRTRASDRVRAGCATGHRCGRRHRGRRSDPERPGGGPGVGGGHRLRRAAGGEYHRCRRGGERFPVQPGSDHQPSELDREQSGWRASRRQQPAGGWSLDPGPRPGVDQRRKRATLCGGWCAARYRLRGRALRRQREVGIAEFLPDRLVDALRVARIGAHKSVRNRI